MQEARYFWRNSRSTAACYKRTADKMYVYRKYILYYSTADSLTASSFHTNKPSPKRPKLQEEM
ncbi:hypothetical protein RO3G_07650 [Rhizopus delemar RA 99-880]|uniref:Uncharacterized protein n=1 Tax=Rhizopus delemar (strain RA 99-880 / ATCC MYA-4621 / FGSC 9543 / NRRL 43880) TaxID=246409 RepID=I1C3B5_RHIO9|nr:hypothetical protein RO3G_07650 [Rhizopus delemar RA 99-880]|eukprot:EIE82945.1 hypothetical protein RO3G_07650 [Rhizopus delemar RA 99-880]